MSDLKSQYHFFSNLEQNLNGFDLKFSYETLPISGTENVIVYFDLFGTKTGLIMNKQTSYHDISLSKNDLIDKINNKQLWFNF